MTGTLPHTASAPRDVTLAWGGDTVGQGWGINPEWGGLRMFETMRRAEPDFFVHSGDTIYADNPLLPEVKLDDGTLWKNLVTPAKSKVAETPRRVPRQLPLQPHGRATSAASTPRCRWSRSGTTTRCATTGIPTQILDEPRYQVKSVALLAARAKQAFLEYFPSGATPRDRERVYRKIAYGPDLEVFVLDMRSYRGPNSANRQPSLGAESAFLGDGPARLARDRARRVARHLEGRSPATCRSASW